MKFHVKELMGIIEKNREAHQAIWKEACEAYATKVRQALEQNLAWLKEGKRKAIHIYESPPINQTKQYDRIIGMLHRTSDVCAELTEKQYAQYVLDDWEWKAVFLATSSKYTGKIYGDESEGGEAD